MHQLHSTLTLIQTSKVRTVPLVAVGKEYWGPLFDWFRTTMLRDHMIKEADLDLFYVADDADDAFRYTLNFHSRHPRTPITIRCLNGYMKIWVTFILWTRIITLPSMSIETP